MSEVQNDDRLDLSDPAFVDAALKRWRTAPVSMIVLEFCGNGDPAFGGSADDRALGVDGQIKERMSRVETAVFTTVQEAHDAATKVTNRRPNSILGVAPRWR
ncbi:hypothetical protein A9R05_44395 (plasmid) [Burkholderia sp. KK1]|uniref:Uncharacterized protein n=1 Tax=Burkholderia sp. M701 TaxID=326454 RepID=V5YPA0_9BURK|nr:hypothetical protein [Burkholderia sp. M701]AQH05991.1 hypothetical protein A9R05_44395 [Burkholderia sp. KK1]BAO19227.1 hypothetical protein [Burkholderia sp. M701]